MKAVLSLLLAPAIAFATPGTAGLEATCAGSPEELVRASTQPMPAEHLEQALSGLEGCPDETKSRIFADLLPASARAGNVHAQFLLAEHHRLHHESGRSVKWMRIASQAGHAGAAAYLADGYAQFARENGLNGAADYIQFAKAKGRSYDALYIEDMLYEAIRLAKAGNDSAALQRAYLNLGNINLYNLDSSSNGEFGEQGFSLGRARSLYQSAIELSRRQGDAVGEAIGLAAFLVSYQYGGESRERCSIARQLKALYSRHRQAIDADPRALGVPDALRMGMAGCGK